MSKNGWTPERRKKQSEMIRNWKPWEHSTGAKTDEGREICKMNAEKHGVRGMEFQRISKRLKELSNYDISY